MHYLNAHLERSEELLMSRENRVNHIKNHKIKNMYINKSRRPKSVVYKRIGGVIEEPGIPVAGGCSLYGSEYE